MLQLTDSASFAEMIQRARERTADVLPDGKSMTRREIAVQAGVSASYITRLEDGVKSPSKQILGRIMAVLAFTPAEARRAYDLLGYEDLPPEPIKFDPSGDMPYLDQLNPAVAGIIDPYWNLRAANDAYETVFPGIGEAANVLKWFFLDPRSRETMVEWKDEADLNVAWLKTTASLNPGDTHLAALFDVLATNDEFMAMYAKPGLTTYRGKPLMLVMAQGRPRVLNVRIFDHPLVGGIKFFIATDVR